MRNDAAMWAPDFTRDVCCLLGVPIDTDDLASAERRIRAAAASRSPCFFSTPNVNWLVACQSDAEFRDSVANSHLSVADGMPLVWLARLAGIPIRERVAGAALFEALRQRPGAPLSVYFFGGPDGVAEQAARKLTLEGGGLTCVGYESPGFCSIEEMSTGQILARINASKADFLVVSLGARKGQAWIEHNRSRLNVPVISHLGAVLHFVAGTVHRAPAWMQRIGLEWVWRIMGEPHLWRRYVEDGAALFPLVLTRLLPYVWHSIRNRPDAEQLAAVRAVAVEVTQSYAIRLQGAWMHSNIPRLRRCFHQAALAGKDVWLDMSGVTHVDSAVVGLVMLLRSHQRQRGMQLRIASPSLPVRTVFRYCCAEYLFSGLIEGAPA
jgi:N-acetylglucosaminyldiphosphoundecaprenol N-acetyl-beta-D-mannosaminyltransferase